MGCVLGLIEGCMEGTCDGCDVVDLFILFFPLFQLLQQVLLLRIIHHIEGIFDISGVTFCAEWID